MCLVNELLGFRLTSEHDDAPDALKGAVKLARSSAQVGADCWLLLVGRY